MNRTSSNPYKFREPLDPEKNQLICIDRKKAIKRITKGIDEGEYFSILGPKQIGKTTFLYQLQKELSKNYYVIYVSCSELPSVPQLFYKQVINKFLAVIPSNYSLKHNTIIEGYGDYSLYGFLSNIKLKNVNARIIFMFDDIEKIDFRTDFLKNWKKIYLDRYKNRILKSYILITTSSVDPLVITSSSNTPFDVSERMQLNDFSSDDVNRFIDRSFRALNIDITKKAKKKLNRQLSGHPAFLQHVCYLLRQKMGNKSRTIKTKDIQISIDELYKTSPHLEIMKQTLKYDGNLTTLIKRILTGERIKYFPYREFSFLGVGLIVDKNGICSIRNSIYQKCLKEQIFPKKLSKVKLAFQIFFICILVFLVLCYIILSYPTFYQIDTEIIDVPDLKRDIPILMSCFISILGMINVRIRQYIMKLIDYLIKEKNE